MPGRTLQHHVRKDGATATDTGLPGGHSLPVFYVQYENSAELLDGNTEEKKKIRFENRKTLILDGATATDTGLPGGHPLPGSFFFRDPSNQERRTCARAYSIMSAKMEPQLPTRGFQVVTLFRVFSFSATHLIQSDGHVPGRTASRPQRWSYSYRHGASRWSPSSGFTSILFPRPI